MTTQLLEAKVEEKGKRNIIEIHKYSIEVGDEYSLLFMAKSFSGSLVK